MSTGRHCAAATESAELRVSVAARAAECVGLSPPVEMRRGGGTARPEMLMSRKGPGWVRTRTTLGVPTWT